MLLTASDLRDGRHSRGGRRETREKYVQPNQGRGFRGREITGCDRKRCGSQKVGTAAGERGRETGPAGHTEAFGLFPRSKGVA